MVAKAPTRTSAATAYAEDVASGRVLAGPHVRQACARHLRDLERQGTPDFPYVFSESSERKFLDFAGFVHLSDGVPFVLEPFQAFIAGCLFGWVDQEGYRRFRTAYIEMGKGNGKTPFAALIGLYGLMADGEWQAEIYSAAVTREQANICFTDAKNMTEGSPSLSGRIDTLEHNLSYGDSFFRAVSSEKRGLDGKRPHFSLIDELHEHPSNVVVQKMRAGMKRRRQPLVLEITNSGYDRHSICWQHHEHSLAVLSETVSDETWFAYVCALDEGDDWRDPEVWLKTNPGLGSILPRIYLEEQVKEAQNVPSSENFVKRLNFCIWTEQATKWFALEDWDACQADIRLEDFEGRRCFIGLDLASTTDIAAAALWFPDGEGGGDLFLQFWVPERAGAQRWERSRVPYPDWIAAGYIEATHGNIIDYEVIRQRIVNDYAERFDVAEIAYDRWNSSQLITMLTEDGANCVPMGQGFASMSDPSKEFEKLIIGDLLRHDGNPVMRWMIGNVSKREDPAGNIKPDREKSAEKIDGIPAAIMAIGRASLDVGPVQAGIFAF